ncbi:MAG: PBP1A family penicillin-binding protein [Anaerolineae bacterium]|nr:PBP1A family penicillin-binding protein [Anaerolineae bacterium]
MSSVFAFVVVVVMIFFLAFASVIVGYVYIANQLPSPYELQTRQTSFVSSKIYDRDGNLLYEVTDPHGGRRTYVPIEEISPYLAQATVATEDRDFYQHPGFDPVAMARAFYYNFSEQRIVSGASTIPQQLARNVLLSPEERYQETVSRKIKEIVLATELSRTYSKNTILEVYLNEAYYGNLAYGIQAAAETYFGVDAADLTLAQASFLAGLPQAPAVYDPFGGGYDQTLGRHEDVLGLMVEAGYIDDAEAALAAAEIRAYEFKAPRIDLTVGPHFVVYVRQTIEATFGPEALYRGAGLRVYTTLDPRLQAVAEQVVRDGVASLADRNATNGALVAIDPATGHILAMVGSAGFRNEAIDGQVNVALRCRQPGSSIKPLTYVAAFERGWTPATLLWDVKKQFPDGANPPYEPVNYDGEYHGPMLLRQALANSYNVPAVDALQLVGVDGLLDVASRMGVQSLVHPEAECPDYPYEQPPSYGLALALGGGEVKLLEMTGAYAVLANGGVRTVASPILRIEDSRGNVLLDNSAPPGDQVISPQHAYLMTSILSDERARCIEFGCPNVLQLNRPAAAKTGTTNDYRDGWTIGYTPDLVTGVWVGNSDNSEMVSLPGSAGAGPIWHDFMEAAHEGIPVHDFVRPNGVTDIEICADSGARTSEYCSRRKIEVFVEDQLPLDADQGWYRMVQVDELTGLLANDYCPDYVVENTMVVIEDLQGREWAQAHPDYFGGVPLAPLEECTEGVARPVVMIADPVQEDLVQGVVSIVGTVQLPNFDRYEVQFGQGADPETWSWLSGPHLAQVRDGTVAQWDVRGLAPGVYTLRVRAFDKEQRRFDGQVRVIVLGPTVTATISATATLVATVTPVVTLTVMPSPTLVPTLEPSPTTQPSPTLVPSPIATATGVPPTPTSTKTPVPSPTLTLTLESTPTVSTTVSSAILDTSGLTLTPWCDAGKLAVCHSELAHCSPCVDSARARAMVSLQFVLPYCDCVASRCESKFPVQS